MFDIAEEYGTSVFKECVALGQSHYEEVEDKASVVPYAVNYDTIEAADSHGMIALVTVRKDGELVGYMANLICEDFLTSQLEAKEIGIYLSPEARGSSAFIRMMSLMEHVVISRGAKAQYLMFKNGHDVGLAERLGYTKTETVYQKLLGVTWQQ